MASLDFMHHLTQKKQEISGYWSVLGVQGHCSFNHCIKGVRACFITAFESHIFSESRGKILLQNPNLTAFTFKSQKQAWILLCILVCFCLNVPRGRCSLCPVIFYFLAFCQVHGGKNVSGPCSGIFDSVKSGGWRKLRHLQWVSFSTTWKKSGFLSLEDSYWAEGGFCSGFIGKKETGM